MRLLTVGHSTHPIAEFVALLQSAGVALLVDVRSYPRSRTNPQFNADVLPRSLVAAGIDYLHLQDLGGRRRGRGNDSPNTLWHNAAFRNYADYAMTAPFRIALQELIARCAQHCSAIMCSEALWWRCHRRIITDYLVAQQIEVGHLMGSGKIDPASLTPGALAQPDGTVVYPGAS